RRTNNAVGPLREPLQMRVREWSNNISLEGLIAINYCKAIQFPRFSKAGCHEVKRDDPRDEDTRHPR
ncbi:MAG: hypothetical protein ACFCUQ_04750, partial [Kiloniellales bacterium]